MRLFITAGFDRAPNACVLCEILSKHNHEIAGICVVTPFNWGRFKSMLRQQGPKIIGRSIRRVLGLGKRKSSRNRPGPLKCFMKAKGVETLSLKRWAAAHGVDYRVLKGLNEAGSVAYLRKCNADVVLYAGGGILRKNFIQAAKGTVLNAHSGPLPEIRGMNACEWSLLLRLQPHVTIHFIDEGIDTGGYLMQIPIPVAPGDTIEDMREKCVVAGIQGLINAVERFAELEAQSVDDPVESRQCFVMAPALREILALRLKEGDLRLEVPKR